MIIEKRVGWLAGLAGAGGGRVGDGGGVGRGLAGEEIGLEWYQDIFFAHALLLYP